MHCERVGVRMVLTGASQQTFQLGAVRCYNTRGKESFAGTTPTSTRAYVKGDVLPALQALGTLIVCWIVCMDYVIGDALCSASGFLAQSVAQSEYCTSKYGYCMAATRENTKRLIVKWRLTCWGLSAAEVFTNSFRKSLVLEFSKPS